MNNLYVWIVMPNGYSHSMCFYEVAESIAKSLDIIMWWGEVPIAKPAIVLGAHLLPAGSVLHEGSRIYNLEVIGAHTSRDYLDLMRSEATKVWDYSKQNIQKLKGHGIEAKYCPIGYHECLTKIKQNPVKDIDVLFYGSMNERRSGIIDNLHAAGVKVHHAFDCYGKERDDLIARSKIVLNMHYYEDAPFEIVRCSYLMANKVFVISESSENNYLDQFEYMDGIRFASYDRLVQVCLDMLSDTSSGCRDMTAQYGYDRFTKTSMEANLKAVL